MLLLTVLTAIAPVVRPAAAQTASVIGTDWVGTIRCDIKATAQGYLHEERQTWTLTGAAPTLQGSMLVYPATWTVTGQGTHDRTGTTSRRVAQWTAAVPGPNPPVIAPVAFSAAPVTGQLNFQPWHSQLTRQGGYTGTDQYINSGVPQPPGRLVATVYEWQFPRITAEPKSTRISGSLTTEVRSQVGPLQPLSESQATVACAWELGQGTATPLPGSPTTPDPSSGSTSSNTPPANPPGSTTTPPGSTASNNPGSTPPGAPTTTPGSTTSPPGGTTPPAGTTTPATNPPATNTARLVSIDKTTFEQGAFDTVVVLTGSSTHWKQATPVVTVEPGIGYQIDTVQAESDTSLYVALPIQYSAATGARSITVTTGTEVVTLPSAFTITPKAKPILSAISPATGTQGAQNVTITITGQNTRWTQDRTTFWIGLPVDGSNPNAQAPPQYVTTKSLTVNSPTSATAVVSIAPEARVGPYWVVVGPGGPDGLLNTTGFTVAAAPASSSNTPPSTPESMPARTVAVNVPTGTWRVGQTHTVTFTHNIADPGGFNLMVSYTLENGAVWNSAWCFTSSAASSGSCTAADTVWPFPSPPKTAKVILTVVNGLQQFSSNSFPIATEVAGITRVNPSSGRIGETIDVEITGQFTEFVGGTTYASFGPDVSAQILRVNSPTSAVVRVALDQNTGVGAKEVNLITGTQSIKLANGFTANPAAPTGTGAATGPLTTPNAPVNSLPGRTPGGGGLTSEPAPGSTATTPATPVDPANFTATQTADGTVQLAWNAVPGAGSYLLGGPGTNVGITVNGTSHTVTGIAPGAHTWTVATNYNPGGILTTADKWSKATATVVNRSGRYRIAINGFRVNRETNAGTFGEHNAVYAAAAIEMLNRQSDLALIGNPAVVRSSVHGDAGRDPSRIRAGSASATGGFLAGDMYPSGQNPAALTASPSTTSFPLLLWEGPLTDAVEAVVVRPTLWVWNGSSNTFGYWQRTSRSEFGISQAGTVRVQELDQIRARAGSGDLSPFRFTAARMFACTSDVISILPQCGPGHDDRPIGLSDDPSGSGFNAWLDLVIVVTREGIERALSSSTQIGGAANGVIPIALVDNGSNWGGNYDLYLKVERVQ